MTDDRPIAKFEGGPLGGTGLSEDPGVAWYIAVDSQFRKAWYKRQPISRDMVVYRFTEERPDWVKKEAP